MKLSGWSNKRYYTDEQLGYAANRLAHFVIVNSTMGKWNKHNQKEALKLAEEIQEGLAYRSDLAHQWDIRRQRVLHRLWNRTKQLGELRKFADKECANTPQLGLLALAMTGQCDRINKRIARVQAMTCPYWALEPDQGYG